MSAVRRLCGECRQWQSRPCGDGCYLLPSDPTEADIFAACGATPPIVAELDGLMQLEPDMSGPLCDAIMAVRNALARQMTPLLSAEALDRPIELEVIQWEGRPHCIYLNNYRVVGAKPWGGGTTIKKWPTSLREIIAAFPELRQVVFP